MPVAVAESAKGRIGDDGEHGSLLDRTARGLEGRGLGGVAGGHAAVSAGAGAYNKKTDPTDCEWIQRLHSCGLLRGAFRPPEQVGMLRTLVRDKANVVAEAGDWVRRMQKSLDQMNVRVHRAVSDLDGVTGLAIVRAIVAGERDARKLAQLRDRRCRQSEAEIAEQLSGHWREDPLFSLRQSLKMYEATQERITSYEQEILRKLGEMTPEERAGQTAPAVKNPHKANASRKRGEEPRRQAWYRMSGVDVTQIDAIGMPTFQHNDLLV